MRRRYRRLLRASALLDAAALLLFFACVVASNHNDWDHFLAAAEVDRRAWLLDHHAPLWSYQLCGGVTRAGDPQAFGLSPLFAWLLAFGAFWGLKTAWAALAAVGFFSLRRVLGFFYTAAGGRLRHGGRAALGALSLAFVLGNYFLWHAHEGHFTIALDYLALAIVALLFDSYSEGFRARKAALAAFLSWAYISAGFYHSAVFFLLPLTLALCLGLGAAVAAQAAGRLAKAGRLRGLLATAGACLAGVLLGGYKLYFVVAYQSEAPRTVAQSLAGSDGANPLQTLVYQLVPTIGDRFLGVFRGWPPWGVWETSAFNLDAWVCLVAAVVLLASRRTRQAEKQRARPVLEPVAWALCAATGLVALWFSLGDQLPGSGFEVLKALTHGSVRVAGRFQVVFAFAAACVAALLLARVRGFRRAFISWGVLIVPALVALNLVGFSLSTLEPGELAAAFSSHAAGPQRMRELEIVRLRSEDSSYMYSPIRRGIGVLNCYDPIARETRLVREFAARPQFLDRAGRVRERLLIPLVDPTAGSPPESCRTGSYFTQDEIVLDPSCPPGTCVNINGLEPGHPSNLALDAARNQYCLAAPR